MIYLELFLVFLKVGALSFGGGMAMISVIYDSVVANGWLSEGELMNMIAVAESTPGPIAVNVATFVGSSQAGFLGALCATTGMVLPSFVIILIISAFIKNFLKYGVVKAVLSGIRPAVVALLIGVVTTLGLKTLLGFSEIGDGVKPDLYGIIILALLFIIAGLYSKLRKKKPSPIIMILISAGLGILFYSL